MDSAPPRAGARNVIHADIRSPSRAVQPVIGTKAAGRAGHLVEFVLDGDICEPTAKARSGAERADARDDTTLVPGRTRPLVPGRSRAPAAPSVWTMGQT